MITEIRQKIALWIYPDEMRYNFSYEEKRRLLSTIAELREQLKIERRQREDIDPKNLMRQLMGLVTVDMEAMEDLYAGLSVEEIRLFHRFGFDLSKNKWWKYLRAHTLNKQAAKTLREVLINERHSWIGAGTINGIMLLDEQVDRLKAAHEEDVAPQEEFDKAKLIQE